MSDPEAILDAIAAGLSIERAAERFRLPVAEVRRILKGVSQNAICKYDCKAKRWWTEKGSDRYLHGERAILAATQYVGNQLNPAGRNRRYEGDCSRRAAGFTPAVVTKAIRQPG